MVSPACPRRAHRSPEMNGAGRRPYKATRSNASSLTRNFLDFHPFAGLPHRAARDTIR
jgi:hypothetical protein